MKTKTIFWNILISIFTAVLTIVVYSSIKSDSDLAKDGLITRPYQVYWMIPIMFIMQECLFLVTVL